MEKKSGTIYNICHGCPLDIPDDDNFIALSNRDSWLAFVEQIFNCSTKTQDNYWNIILTVIKRGSKLKFLSLLLKRVYNNKE